MRALPLLLLLSGCNAMDPLVGSFNFTLTGTDTQTAPNASTATATGTGTLAVTAGKMDKSFVVTIAETDSTPYACTLLGTRDDKVPLTINITSPQTCAFNFSGGSGSAVISSGTVKVDTETGNNGTLTVSYSYSGNTIIGINFAGTGMRTYTGMRF